LMDEENPNEFPYIATCPFCGTQTRVALRAPEEDAPVKCTMCGAPLEIELPEPRTKRVRKKPRPAKCSQCGVVTDVSRIYYFDGTVLCERCNESLARERDKWEQKVVVVGIILGLLVAAFIVVVLATWPY
jgi:transcription elongation factor Elf1